MALTVPNDEAWLQEMPKDTLSKTFYGATVATQQLNVRFSWVDSMCNMQGIKRDWYKKASSMLHVYQHSVFNLSALQSQGNEEGRSFLRESSQILPLLIVSPGSLGTRASELINVLEPELSWNSEVDSKPTDSHDQVIQERCLPHRVLYFS